MKILMVGDVVGSAGRTALARVTAAFRQDGRAEVVVANAENAAGGQGLSGALAEEIFRMGVDVITLGDHAWDQKDMVSYIEREGRVIRPLNLAPGCPGKGFVTVKTPAGPVTVISLIGRTFMRPYDCPFRAADALLAKEPTLAKVIVVDMHAEATSEKIVIGRYLDGRVSAVLGTHTHVQTSDETILPRGTAYLTDLGMTGPKDSALGRDLASVTRAFLTGMPTRFESAKNDVVLEGAIITVDDQTGKAKSIKRIREPVL